MLSPPNSHGLRSAPDYFIVSIMDMAAQTPAILIGAHPYSNLPVTPTNVKVVRGVQLQLRITIVGSSGLMWLEESLPPTPQYNWNNNTYHQGDVSTFSYVLANYDFNGWKQASGLDTNSAFTASSPTGIKVFVRSNSIN